MEISELTIPLVVIGLITLAIVAKLIARSMDGGRIDDYVRSKGGKLLDRRWSPFGKGWYGSKNERIYEIRYEDPDGNERAATCKTSLFSGVYFTDDHMIREGSRAESATVSGAEIESELEVSMLAVENRRLREELERLRGQS